MRLASPFVTCCRACSGRRPKGAVSTGLDGHAGHAPGGARRIRHRADALCRTSQHLENYQWSFFDTNAGLVAYHVLYLDMASGCLGQQLMRRQTITACAAFALAGPLWAQTTRPPLLCDVKATTLEVDVAYDPGRRVYTYAYTLAAPSSNTGLISDLQVDISAERLQNPSDPDLRNDATRVEATPPMSFPLTPRDAVAVGLSSPNDDWVSGVGRKIALTVNEPGFTATTRPDGGAASWGAPSDLVYPGETRAGFIMESKAPPAPRAFTIDPDVPHCLSLWPNEGWWPKDFAVEPWLVTGMTVGPMLEDEGPRFNGGGQRPVDVNRLLWYRAPLESRTTLPAGQTEYDLIIYYGKAIHAVSFQAVSNGADVTSLFEPTPGIAEVVRLPLRPGRNTVKLSVDGWLPSGRVATDTDRLVFLVP